MSKRKGPWFQTYTGRAWYPLDPRPEDVCLEDVAHGLAYQCRFNGHCREFYSVAEHSTRCAEVLWQEVGSEAAMCGLLHDAAEAYLGDIVSPVKALLPEYKELESNNLDAIHRALGIGHLRGKYDREIKQIDRVMLVTEQRDLMSPAPQGWGFDGMRPLEGKIVPNEPGIAMAWFVAMYEFIKPIGRG